MDDLKTALSAMTGNGKRARVHDAQMVTKLPKAVKELVIDFGKKNDMSEAAVVRDALSEYFSRRGYNR